MKLFENSNNFIVTFFKPSYWIYLIFKSKYDRQAVNYFALLRLLWSSIWKQFQCDHSIFSLSRDRCSGRLHRPIGSQKCRACHNRDTWPTTYDGYRWPSGPKLGYRTHLSSLWKWMTCVSDFSNSRRNEKIFWTYICKVLIIILTGLVANIGHIEAGIWCIV